MKKVNYEKIKSFFTQFWALVKSQNRHYIIFLEKIGKTCDEPVIGPFFSFQGTFDLAYLPINLADIGFLSEVMLKHTAPHDIDDAKASNVDLNNNKQTTLKLLHS